MAKRTQNRELLPDDVIFHILKFLPAKSLLRFKYVSKYWYTLIKSPYFIKNHLVKQQECDSTVLLLWKYLPVEHNNIQGVFSFHNPKSPKLNEVCSELSVPFTKSCTNLTLPFPCPSYLVNGIHFLGPCDGLFCIAVKKKFTICNPILREYKELPKCPSVVCSIIDFNEELGGQWLGQGFGKTHTGKYKVVLIRAYCSCYISDQIDFHAHVYNLSTNSWKRIDSNLKVLVAQNYQCFQVVLNDVCHWRALSFRGNKHRHVILSFNLSTENFEEFEYPDCLSETNSYISEVYLMVISECLSLVSVDWESAGAFEIWVMKEYGAKDSWTKRIIRGPYKPFIPLMFWKNDKWLLGKRTDDDQLVSYALDKRGMKLFNINGSENILHAIDYQESLISLDDVMKVVPMIKLD